MYGEEEVNASLTESGSNLQVKPSLILAENCASKSIELQCKPEFAVCIRFDLLLNLDRVHDGKIMRDASA